LLVLLLPSPYIRLKRQVQKGKERKKKEEKKGKPKRCDREIIISRMSS
jgi:hypothetical protein